MKFKILFPVSFVVLLSATVSFAGSASKIWNHRLSHGAAAAVVANAGLDQDLQLPTSQFTLNGSASQGTNLTYSWTQLDGPPLTITNASQAIATVSNLVAGEFTFSLTVTDGITQSIDDVTIVIHSEITSPGTNNHNFVKETIVRVAGITDMAGVKALNAGQRSITYSYMDGLGRPVQVVQQQNSPAYRDIVTPIAYDEYGRENKKYLSYVEKSAISNGSFKLNAISNQNAFYRNPGSSEWNAPKIAGTAVDHIALSGTLFEASPLNRVLEQGAPGAEWQLSNSGVAGAGHTIKTEYAGNDASSLTTGSGYWAKQFGVSIAADGVRTLTYQGSYGLNQLYVTVSKDENWVSGKPGTTEEYKDKEGRVVLKRTFNLKDGILETLSTYYVYDDFGNLCFVLPPNVGADNVTAAPSQTTLNNLAYQYRYDGRQRLVEKKVPGKALECYVYNKLDQLVAREDGKLRGGKNWEYSKYDELGRLVRTGWWKHLVNTVSTQIARQELQTLVDSYSGPLWDTRASDTLGYDNLAWPITDNYYVVNYYDDYDVYELPATFEFESYAPVSGSDNEESEMTTALPTVVRTASVDYIAPRWTVNFYNADGRLIQVQKNNKVSNNTLAGSAEGRDIVNNEYDFPGKVVLSTRKHTSPVYAASAPLLIRTRYTYDHADRPVATYKRIGTNPVTDPEVRLAHQEYNELGQLVDKKLHLKEGNTKSLQSVDYRYNIRGWLSSVNDPVLSATPNGRNTDDASSDGDKFGMALAYQDAAIVQYNGNIGSMSWKSAGTAALSFDYRYDKLNRLIHAESSTAGVKDRLYSEYLRYDVMGNIESLGRSADVSGRKNIDSLSYFYNDSKQVWKVDDNSTDLTNRGMIFNDNGSTGTTIANGEMKYDVSGNLTKDLNKGISSMTYSIINMPATVTRTNGDLITYEYERTGVKLRKLYKAAGTTTQTKTDYIDGIQYEKSADQMPPVLTLIQTEEGRVIPNGGSFLYQYDLKDHLGNTRTSIQPLFSDASQTTAEVIQENSYYPFGADMPNMAALQTGTNKYLYNGKEKQEEMGGLYEYGARFYDPTIGRWNAVDNSAEKYYRHSPYSYAINNPIIYIDPDGNDIYKINQETGEMEQIKTKNKSHSYYLVGADGKETFVGKFKYNKNGLIKLPSSFSAKDGQNNKFGFNVKEGNGDQAYIRGDAMGSLLGALAETGTSDLTVNGFSLSNGSSPDPSVSHKAGKNGDLRYLSENENGEKVILGQSNLDMSRQNNLNDALYKFGWKDMISERFKPYGSSKSTLLNHTSSATARGIPTNHSNHLHLQGYSPSISVIYRGGELQSVTITAKRNQ